VAKKGAGFADRRCLGDSVQREVIMKSWRLALVVALCAACPAEAKAQGGAIANGVKNVAKAAKGIPKAVPKRLPTVRPVSPGGARSAAAGMTDEGASAAFAKRSAAAPALEGGASGSAIAGAAGEAPESSLREAAGEAVQGIVVDEGQKVFESDGEAGDQAKARLSPSQVKLLKDFQRSKAEAPAGNDWAYPLGLVVLVAGIWFWARRA
jgi:hypothetical protein